MQQHISHLTLGGWVETTACFWQAAQDSLQQVTTVTVDVRSISEAEEWLDTIIADMLHYIQGSSRPIEVVVLCNSDDQYCAYAPRLVELLQGVGHARVVCLVSPEDD